MVDIEDIKKQAMQTPEAQQSLRYSILHSFVGPITHGTYNPKYQEIDIRTVDVFPLSFYLGLQKSASRDVPTRRVDDVEIISRDIKEFADDCLRGDIDSIALLWTDDSHVNQISEGGYLLKLNRHLFVSKILVKHIISSALRYLDLSNTYFKGHRYFGVRNVDEFGYDTRDMSEAFRLIFTALKLARTGEFVVHLEPRELEYVVAIRNGVFRFEVLQHEADVLIDDIRDALDENTSLPLVPDRQSINDLIENILMLELGLVLFSI